MFSVRSVRRFACHSTKGRGRSACPLLLRYRNQIPTFFTRPCSRLPLTSTWWTTICTTDRSGNTIIHTIQYHQNPLSMNTVAQLKVKSNRVVELDNVAQSTYLVEYHKSVYFNTHSRVMEMLNS